MFRKFIFLVLLMYVALLLTGAEFEDFAIGAWYPWYNGEAIDADSVGSIHSLKEIGFNSVYWVQNPTPTHYNLVSDEDMKGYFYSSSAFAQLCRSSMAYKYETYTLPGDTLIYNPTAWDTMYCDSIYDPTTLPIGNGWSIRVNMGKTGTILSHLKPGDYNYWAYKAIYSGKYATSVVLSDTNKYARLDELYNVDSVCHEDSLCSLDKLCEGTVVEDWEADTVDGWIYRTQGIGVIVKPRIRVANPDPTDTTILCRIIIITDKDTTSHDVMRHEFTDTDYHDDIGNFKFMFRDNDTHIQDIVVEIPPDTSAPDTFWIDYIELRDAFANYIIRKYNNL